MVLIGPLFIPTCAYNQPKNEVKMADLAKQVGARIKRVRREAKLTQAELAEKIGVGTTFISRIERGATQPPLKTLAALAGALNVSAVDLFDFKGPVVFREGKQGARQRKECLESVQTMLKDMDLRELLILQEITRALIGK